MKRVQLLILKIVYSTQWNNQYRERRFKNTKIFILVHPTKRATSSPLLHSKDFTKNNQTDQVYNTCSQQEYIAPRSKPLLNLQQTKKPHRTHYVFKEHPCWNLQQVTFIQN